MTVGVAILCPAAYMGDVINTAAVCGESMECVAVCQPFSALYW